MYQNKLLFDISMEEPIDDTSKPIWEREAVRSIAVKDNRILMITSSRGDCKLPGGGIEKGETHHKALYREMLEETGIACSDISPVLGKVFEKKTDVFDSSKIFQHTSYYYAVCITDNIQPQTLDKYEKELGFEPNWLTIDEAIKINSKYLRTAKIIDWTKRENKILQIIKDIGLDRFEGSIKPL